MRRTKEEAEVTRQRLLKAALDVFSRKGYADTRLEDIAAEAGVTRGAIYHHFGNAENQFNGKAELYNTLISEAYARFTPVMQEAVESGGFVLDSLKQLLLVTLKFAATDPEFRAISELMLFKTAIVPELEEGIQQKIRGTHNLVEFIADLVEKGKAEGEIRSDANARDVALALLGLQNGLLAIWLMDKHLFSLKDRADEIADIFLRGITA
jgi:TetR/AcrR family acrAB operon transcriptional repressor